MKRSTNVLFALALIAVVFGCTTPDQAELGTTEAEPATNVVPLSKPVLIKDFRAISGTPGAAGSTAKISPAEEERLLAEEVARFAASNTMQVETFVDRDGQLVDMVKISGRPPRTFEMSAVPVPEDAAGVLSDVPAFDWSYGCSATSAAMMAGYYDRGDYTNMYAGPTNGGVMPLNNSAWGAGECPLSATHKGKDGRVAKGHVDDYWVSTGSTAADPYVTGGWTQHTYGDCTGDYMGTNQVAAGNQLDGQTLFWFGNDGTRLYNYTAGEPGQRDGCHGLRDFFESRGYTVEENFNQYIMGFEGNTQGFTLDEFKAEIDAGRPVLIHVTDHTMLGYGYNAGTSTIYIHDTWNYTNHTMTWGGSYSGLAHYGVSVIKLAPACPCSGVSQCCDGCHYITGSCNADSNGCTTGDACSRGVCVVGTGTPDCSAQADDCNAGECSSTGASSYTCVKNPTPKNGTLCNFDSYGCTYNDTCSNGTCVAGTLITCADASNQCNDGYCNPTGINSYTCRLDPTPYEGLACNWDSNGCTVGDKCVAGLCQAGPAPDCSAFEEQCKEGRCVNKGINSYECISDPVPRNGVACNADSTGCTVGDVCMSGDCVAGPAPDCSAKTDQCGQGYCYSTTINTYLCMRSTGPFNGLPCNADNSGCTENDTCAAGNCIAGEAPACSGVADQCNAALCTSTGPTSYTCTKNPAPREGSLCNADSSGCTMNDACVLGTCVPGSTPECAVSDPCTVGVCQSTGSNAYRCSEDYAILDGQPCNSDSNGCTVDDTCSLGRCIVGHTPDCTAQTDQCNIGTCHSTASNEFECVKSPGPKEGAFCNADSNGCTIDDKCVSGACVAGSAPNCSSKTDQCNTGVCNSTGDNTRVCVKNPIPHEGMACNADSDGCTTGDVCQSGSCLVGVVPDCSSEDDECNTGACRATAIDAFQCVKNPVPKEGFACNADSDGCTANDKCSVGTCAPGPTPDCSSVQDQCNAGSCSSTGINTHECIKNPAPLQGVQCNADDSGCTVGDKCDSGSCVAGAVADCSAAADQCNLGICNSTGVHSYLCRKNPAPFEGLTCNADSSGCTVDDKCASGTCTAGAAADCTAMDDQCNTGLCNSTGDNEHVCVKSSVPNEGHICNADSDGCTANDMCSSGNCVVGAAADCSGATDQCNTGYCSSTGNNTHACLKNPTGFEGLACDADSSGCTVDDKCSSGRCTPGAVPDCSSLSDECNAGTCSSTGTNSHVCTKDPGPMEGRSCNADSDGCTINDRCTAGSCVVGEAWDCSYASDQCNTGVCQSTGTDTHICLKDPVPMEGLDCNADYSGCTVGDKCAAGNCIAGPAPDCSGMDDQCNVGYCGSTGLNSYACLKDSSPFDGLLCDADASGCTTNDRCTLGTCLAGTVPNCSFESDQCNTGTCSSTGSNTHECIRNPVPNEGQLCNADFDGCTANDACVSGECIAGTEPDCSSVNDQCNTGFCNSTGLDTHECLKNPAPQDGLACDTDNSGCTVNDACVMGSCIAGPAPDCSAAGDQCNTGTCDSTGPNSFECRSNPVPKEGTGCNADSNGCTADDKCASGTCVTGVALDCRDQDDQCNTGFCRSTGDNAHQCLKNPVPFEGLRCNSDNSGCTIDDTCILGSCTAGLTPDCGGESDQCNTGTCKSTGANDYECRRDPTPHEGAVCNSDDNGCTVDDVCVSGSCITGSAADCSASNDQCNTAFCSSTGAGTHICMKNPAAHEGLACNADHDGCTTDDACVLGSCLPGSVPDCSASADQCNAGICSSTGDNTHTCVKNPGPMEGVLCNADSNGCSVDDTCTSGTCKAGPQPDCSTADDQCNTGTCNSTGLNSHECVKDPTPREGLSCNADSSGCTADDRCAAGSCMAGDVPDCSTANDQCNAGYCSSTGSNTHACLKNPAPFEGDLCDSDADGCTVGDACVLGSCAAGPAPDCSAASDQCNTGTCSSTGTTTYVCIQNPAPNEGHICDSDGNGCTADDSCVLGVCVKGSTADCSAADDQCNTGYCNSTGANTHECVKNPAAFEGLGCDSDADGCTVNDACVLGSCVAGSAPDCSGENDQCNAGVCNSTGSNAYECGKNPAPREGVPCDADSSGCTVNDACVLGTCVAGSAPDCTDEDDQCHLGICNSTGANAYQCLADAAAMEGRACTDANRCTTGDECVSGSCVGTAKSCTDNFDCTRNSCDPTTGSCVTSVDNASCDDGNQCTVDACTTTAGCVNTVVGEWAACTDSDHACFNGKCEPLAENDMCARALQLAVGKAEVVSAAGYHSFQPIPESCLGRKQSGPDAFFSFTMEQGHNYELTVTADPGTTVATAIWSACGLTGDCLNGVDVDGTSETLTMNDGDLPQTVIIQVVVTGCKDYCVTPGYTVVVTDVSRPGDESGDITEADEASSEEVADASEDVADGTEYVDAPVTPDDINVQFDTSASDVTKQDPGNDTASDVTTAIDAPGDTANSDTGIQPQPASSGCSASDSGHGREALIIIPLFLLAIGIHRLRRRTGTEHSQH